MKKTVNAAPYLPYISGLKGLAILLVMLHHWGTHGQIFVGEDYHVYFVHALVMLGQFGVSLFFMVSAFTLQRSYAQLEHQVKYPFLAYYIRRCFRILPPWWCSIIFYTTFHNRSFSDYWIHFGMLFGFFPKAASVFGGEWSLFVEESFYIFLPLLFPLIKTLRAHLIFLSATILLRFGWLQWIAPGLGLPDNFALTAPFTHWYSFVLGLILYEIIEKRQLPKTTELSRVLGMILIFATPFIMVHPKWGIGDMRVNIYLAIVFFLASQSKGIVSSIMRVRPLEWFGISCYSIYMYHEAVIQIIHETKALVYFLVFLGWREKGDIEWRLLVTFPIYALICLGVGTVLHYTIERSSIKLGKRLQRSLLKLHLSKQRQVIGEGSPLSTT